MYARAFNKRKLTKRQSINLETLARRDVVLKTIFLASLLFLAGCKTTDYLYVIDTDHGICSRRKITNRETWQSRWDADLPIEACDGFVAITPEDFARETGKRPPKK